MDADTLKTKIAHAELNLQRKLEWMSRYDTRIVFVAGVAIAMLGVLADVSGSIECWSGEAYFVFGLAFALQSISLIFVYYTQHPKINAPNESLLFFGTIGKMAFNDFRDKFMNLSEEKYLEDLLHQTHINSMILTKKFINLRNALIFIALSVLPWVISIYLSKTYQY